MKISEDVIDEWWSCRCMSGTNCETKKKAASAARKVLELGEEANTRDREVYSKKLRLHMAGCCKR